MNLSIFFIPEVLFYEYTNEYTNEYTRVYAVMISTILSSAA